MRIKRNAILGTWELAESDSPVRVGLADQIPCQKNRVLIVDDEQPVRQAFQVVLSHDLPNVDIDLASNGKEATELFRSRHHSVILMDLFMPVMNGEVAFRTIEQHCAKEKWMLPAVVFCTGFNPSEDIRDAVSSNPRHCMLQKPVRNKLLSETVLARL